jgi:hypothetical protein
VHEHLCLPDTVLKAACRIRKERAVVNHYAIVGPGASTGNIVLATVENRYRGKQPGVPDTPYLLLVQVLDEQGFTEMTRVIGITKQIRDRLDKEAIPFVETSANIEMRLNEHFKVAWAQFQQCFQEGYNFKPLSNLVQ